MHAPNLSNIQVQKDGVNSRFHNWDHADGPTGEETWVRGSFAGGFGAFRILGALAASSRPPIAQQFESDQPPPEDSNSDMSEPPRRAPRLGDACAGSDQSSLEEKIIL
jgi:hypothetical protein